MASFPAAGLPVLARSSWWRSAAWPDPNEPEYRNGIAFVETTMPPEAVLEALSSIEQAFDRKRIARNAPRTLDLDLIAHGRQIIDRPGLVVPHPRAHERRFVMGPIAELAPDWVHPALGASARQLAASAAVGRDARPS